MASCGRGGLEFVQVPSPGWLARFRPPTSQGGPRWPGARWARARRAEIEPRRGRAKSRNRQRRCRFGTALDRSRRTASGSLGERRRPRVDRRRRGPGGTELSSRSTKTGTATGEGRHHPSAPAPRPARVAGTASPGFGTFGWWRNRSLEGHGRPPFVALFVVVLGATRPTTKRRPPKGSARLGRRVDRPLVLPLWRHHRRPGGPGTPSGLLRRSVPAPGRVLAQAGRRPSRGTSLEATTFLETGTSKSLVFPTDEELAALLSLTTTRP